MKKTLDDIQYFAEDIIDLCNKTTSANYMHHITHVRACAETIIQIIKEDAVKQFVQFPTPICHENEA